MSDGMKILVVVIGTLLLFGIVIMGARALWGTKPASPPLPPTRAATPLPTPTQEPAEELVEPAEESEEVEEAEGTATEQGALSAAEPTTATQSVTETVKAYLAGLSPDQQVALAATLSQQVPETTTTLTGTVPGGSWVLSGPLARTTTTATKVAEVGVNDVRQVVMGIENVGADPGVFLTEDCSLADASVSANCSFRSNVQWTLQYSGTAYVRLPEADPREGAGYVMVTGGYFNLLVQNGTTVELTSEEDVSWIAIVRGPIPGDGTTPRDGNWKLGVEGYNPGFTMASVLCPGQYVSAEFISQNTRSAFRGECGNDGCSGGVGVIIYDVNDHTISVTFWDGEQWLPQFRNWEMP